MELTSVVSGDGLYPISFVPEYADCPSQGLVFGCPVEFADADDSGLSFHDGHHARLSCSMNRVDFPITDSAPSLDHRRPCIYHLLASQAASAVVTAVTLASLLPCTSQVLPEETSTAFIGPDPAVDGLMAHDLEPLHSSASNNLLRTLLPAEHHLDRPKGFLPKVLLAT